MDLSHIYKDLIIDYSRNPKNFYIDETGIKISANNPLCGDSFTLYLRVEDKKIVNISFVGEGCAISKASASIMTDMLTDKRFSEAIEIFENLHHMLTTENFILTEEKRESLEKLQIFEHLHTLPMRVKCATTAWHPLINYIKNLNDNSR